MAWGAAICLPKTRQRPISCRRRAPWLRAEAAHFGQVSVLAQRRVLLRWNWLMIPSMTTLRTRHLPRLQQVHHQRRRRRHLHGPCRRRSRNRHQRLRSHGRRRGRDYRR